VVTTSDNDRLLIAHYGVHWRILINYRINNMIEFIYERSETSAENASSALTMFPFLGKSGAENLIRWMESKLSVRGAITWSELETLEGLVY